MARGALPAPEHSELLRVLTGVVGAHLPEYALKSMVLELMTVDLQGSGGWGGGGGLCGWVRGWVGRRASGWCRITRRPRPHPPATTSPCPPPLFGPGAPWEAPMTGLTSLLTLLAGAPARLAGQPPHFELQPTAQVCGW